MIDKYSQLPISNTKIVKTMASIEEIESLVDSYDSPRKKVLLVDGNGITYGKDVQYSFEGSGITPFGLARLTSYLEKYGVPVTLIRLLDFQTTAGKKVLMQYVKEHDIIGVSTLSTDIDSTFTFCLEVKRIFPKKIIIGGAEHIALDAEWILKNKNISGIDAVCNGEGEIPLLALALGFPIEQIGSLSFVKGESVVRNYRYGRLNDKICNSKLMHPEPAKQLPKRWLKMIFPEMKGGFKYCGNAQTGSGCPFNCEFCTNGPFMGAKRENFLTIAEKEIESQYQADIDFIFFRDAITNTDPCHLDQFIGQMKAFNKHHKKPIGWFAFMSAIKGEDHRRFKDMADAGCIMIGVGVEDVVGNRLSLGKGADAFSATDFIDEAKKHVLVRTLMILGLPQHYNFSREEIKTGILSFMKNHPQVIYRFNQWTPLVGTKDFTIYKDALLVDPRLDPKGFRKFDTMHNVVNAKAMYERMETPKEKMWVKDPEDWTKLRNEILVEYLRSPEYFTFLETLKGKVNLGKKNLLHTIASNFRTDILMKI